MKIFHRGDAKRPLLTIKQLRVRALWGSPAVFPRPRVSASARLLFILALLLGLGAFLRAGEEMAPPGFPAEGDRLPQAGAPGGQTGLSAPLAEGDRLPLAGATTALPLAAGASLSTGEFDSTLEFDSTAEPVSTLESVSFPPGGAYVSRRRRHGFSSAAAVPGGAPLPAEGERFRTIIQRNIFSKTGDSSVPRARSAAVSTDSASACEVVLVGVRDKDQAITAFIEDRRTRTVRAVRPGDTLGGGTVTVITLDSLEFKCGDTCTVIKIGKTLDGNAPSAPAGSAPGPLPVAGEARGSSPAAAAGTAPSESSILERLRKKRQEELR